jgi:putative ABC transport system permease protein
MISDYFSLAFKNLKKRGVRSWLTMLGIFIGIAAVVSLITLGAGLQSAITGQFSSLSVDTLTISNEGTGFGPPGSTAVVKLNKDDLELVEGVSGVKIVVPRLIRVVSVEFNDAREFRYIGSISEDKDKQDFIYTSLGVNAESGRMLKTNDLGKIVVGNDFTDESLFDKPVRVGSNLEINGKEFEVIGIMEKASTFQINSVIMMLESDMEDLLDIDDEIDLIVAQVEDRKELEEVAERIEQEFYRDRNLKVGEEDFSVETPLQAVEGVNNILVIINLIVVGIAAISLLVGGIGIMNTMYTSVLERTREIGIMKAVGARNQDVLAIFLIESGLLGLVGGIVGAAIGLGFAFLVQGVAGSALGGIDLGVKISYPLLIGAISFSFLIGVFSGVLPAMQASRLNVVDALRS